MSQLQRLNAFRLCCKCFKILTHLTPPPTRITICTMLQEPFEEPHSEGQSQAKKLVQTQASCSLAPFPPIAHFSHFSHLALYPHFVLGLVPNSLNLALWSNLFFFAYDLVFLGPSSGASGHPPGLSSGFSASYFFSFLVNVIRSSFHLLMKRIKSYLNERKYEIPEF